VVELLKMLASIGKAQSKRFASMGDLVKLDATEHRDSPGGGRPPSQSLSGDPRGIPQRRPRSLVPGEEGFGRASGGRSSIDATGTGGAAGGLRRAM
jgi:hypothetical protein